MLKQELIYSHIIVAIFCGWEACKLNKEFPHGYLKMIEEGEDPVTVSNDDILEELPYSTDWNYLMPAYNEFRTKAEDLLDIDGNEIMKIRDSLIDAILDHNLDLAFKELVRGVNELNQVKLQEHED